MNINNIKKLKFINGLETIEEKLLTSVPYPQADDVKKLYSYAIYLSKGEVDQENLKEIFGLHMRQLKYYGQALVYLDLAIKKNEYYLVNKDGYKLANSSIIDRKKIFIEKCLQIPTIRQSYFKFLNASPLKINILKKFIISQIKIYQGHKYSDSTLSRRANTIYRWLVYIDDNINEVIK